MKTCAIISFIGLFLVIQGQIAFGDVGDMWVDGIKAKSSDEIKLVSKSKYGACSLLHKKNVFSDESGWYFRCLTGTIAKVSRYYSYPIKVEIQCTKYFRMDNAQRTGKKGNAYNVYLVSLVPEWGSEHADYSAETVDARFRIGTAETVELSTDSWARGQARFRGEQIAKLIDLFEKSKRGNSFVFQFRDGDVHSIKFTGEEREGISLFLSKCKSF